VAPSTLNLTGFNFNNCGFYLSAFDGFLDGQDGTHSRPYNPPGICSEGTRISVRLDCDAHTLTFGVNGVWLPPAWTDLPAVELFPAFDVDVASLWTVIEVSEWKRGGEKRREEKREEKRGGRRGERQVEIVRLFVSTCAVCCVLCAVCCVRSCMCVDVYAYLLWLICLSAVCSCACVPRRVSDACCYNFHHV
jgi:hypothetical protein